MLIRSRTPWGIFYEEDAQMLMSYCQTMVAGAMGPLEGLLSVSCVALRRRGINLR